MDTITRRIVARYQRQVFAAFLSVKWFKAQKDALKNVLKTPLKDNPEYWGWKLREEVLPFFNKFLGEFEELVPLDTVRDSIKDRVDMAKSYIDGVASKLPESGGYVDFKDPKAYLRWYALQAIYDKMKEQAGTIGDLLKSSWSIDMSVVDKLVEATLKKATPEERASLTDDNYRIKYDFLARIAFQKTALRALKRSKLDWDPNKWVDRIFDMLAANYSERAIQESGAFREFDLHGIKVIVDDRTVDTNDVKRYVEYLTKAHAYLKAKGFEKAWYGNVFIQCNDCGGVNPNTGGSTGGWYEYGRDTITIFNRPGPFLVELMVHELGHRYWFKQMNSAQRARFEALVKTHTKPRPAKPNVEVRLFKDRDIGSLKKRIEEAERSITATWNRARKYDLANLTSMARDGISKDGWAFGAEVIEAITSLDVDKDLGSEVDSLKDDVYKTRAQLVELFEDFSLTTAETKADWLTKTNELIGKLVSEAFIFIDFATQKHNERAKERLKNDPATLEWMESFEKNPAPVAPVSTYGASNIDEAFAEVFAHYVLEYEITRDQAESFRTVLKTADDIAPRVAARFAAKKYDHIDFKPPESVANAAKKGLEYRKKAKPSNKGGLTPSEAAKEGIGSGVQRAVNLKNRDNVSPEVIRQMNAFFSRHEKNKSVAPEFKNEPWNDKGYVSWLLWGGDPGQTWAAKILKQMKAADAS
jgi:hypothetical protein